MVEQEQLQDILNDCIDRLGRGASLEDCLTSYPAYANDLRPMLEAGVVTRRAYAPVSEVVEAQERVRLQIAQAAAQRVPAAPVSRRPGRLFAALAAILIMAFGVVGVLAQGSLPGDALYGTKRLSETLVNIVAGGSQSPEDQFAERRLEEIEALLALGRSETVGFRGEIEIMQGAIWRVAGLSLSITPETTGVEGSRLGERVDVTARTTASSTLIAQTIIPVETRELAEPLPEPDEDSDEAVMPSPTATTLPNSPEPSATETPVPSPTQTATASPAGGPSPSPEGCTPVLPPGWVIYTIQPGNTLSGLASATNTTIDDLLAVNCLEDARFIVAGQRLYLPAQPAVQPPPPPPPQPGGNPGGGGSRPPANNNDDDDGGDDDD